MELIHDINRFYIFLSPGQHNFNLVIPYNVLTDAQNLKVTCYKTPMFLNQNQLGLV
jgi:hypothetical protein